MRYKIAEDQDLDMCNQLVADCCYYDAIDLRTIGGYTLVAFDGERVAAVLWLCLTGNRAYLDYFVAHPDYPGAGVRLLVKAKQWLEEVGIREVLYGIHNDNPNIVRIAAAFETSMYGPYVLCSTKIGRNNGN